jgi:hypothetical protein
VSGLKDVSVSKASVATPSIVVFLAAIGFSLALAIERGLPTPFIVQCNIVSVWRCVKRKIVRRSITIPRLRRK